MRHVQDFFSTGQVALYGSTTVSDTLGEGITEKVSIMPHCWVLHWKKNTHRSYGKNKQQKGRKKLLSHYHWGPYTYITYDVF